MSHKYGNENSSIKWKKGARTAIPNVVKLTGARMAVQEFLKLLRSSHPKAPQRRC